MHALTYLFILSFTFVLSYGAIAHHHEDIPKKSSCDSSSRRHNKKARSSVTPFQPFNAGQLKNEASNFNRAESEEEIDKKPLVITECNTDDNLSTEQCVYHRFNLSELELGRTLGIGSFGRVQLVRHISTGRYFALKKLKKTEVIEMKQILYINRERKLLECARNHPFLVQMIGTSQDAGYLYVLMEYVSGGELFTLLRKEKTMSDSVVQFYAAQVILAFEHLHSQNIIYRDLKPENILITRDGNIKIVDFGLAKEVLDQTWTLCGSPGYLAPEIILSKGYGRAVDYYALGVLIYEMLTGFPPFYHVNHIILCRNIVHDEARFPSTFDPVAKDLVMQLLEKNPAKRLGVQSDGISALKRHAWFKDVNWEMLGSCTIRAPYKPKIASEGDCSNFDIYPEETEEEQFNAQTSIIGSYSIQDMMNLFPDF